MGLSWEMAQFGRRRIGRDVNGDEYAFVLRSTVAGTTGWDAYVQPIGSGDPKGVWLYGHWPTADEAMDVADRHVVAHVDSGPRC